MAEPTTAARSSAGREVLIPVGTNIDEIRHSIKRVERKAQSLGKELAYLSEILPGLGIQIVLETTSSRE